MMTKPPRVIWNPVQSQSERSTAIDSLRAIAILLMILDHILIVSGNADSILRLTVTRFSMPLFFLVSGHLVKRINLPRLSVVAAFGALLPQYVPWIDNPNVLLWYAFAAPIVVLANRRALFIILAAAVALYANGYGLVPGSYAPAALLGLMAVGKLARRKDFPELPSFAFVRIFGKYPLTFYVTQALIFELLRDGSLR